MIYFTAKVRTISVIRVGQIHFNKTLKFWVD